jgi:hypothetical protein
MESSDFGKNIRYAYGAEHTHLEFILISAAACTCIQDTRGGHGRQNLLTQILSKHYFKTDGVLACVKLVQKERIIILKLGMRHIPNLKFKWN